MIHSMIHSMKRIVLNKNVYQTTQKQCGPFFNTPKLVHYIKSDRIKPKPKWYE